APDAMADYLEFRAALEGESAAFAAERASPAEQERIAGADAAMAAAVRRGDLDAAATADVEFHMAIVEAAGNLVAIQVARSLHELLRRGVERSHRLSSGDADAWADLSAQHGPITAAIADRDAAAARRAMRAHLERQGAMLGQAEKRAVRDALDARRRAWAAEAG
ncbi:MAG: FCD domain-containing protein, partial [Pseudomonadota bacterium]